VETPQAAQPRHHRGERRIGGHRRDRGIEAVAAISGHQHRVERFLVGQLQSELVEALSAQPPLMSGRPGLTVAIQAALTQQQFGEPMAGAHQISAAVLAGTHQIPGCFLRHSRDRDFHDLAQMQQPGQMTGIPGVGFNSISRRANQLRRRGHQTAESGSI
jgi:hypothetical protein